MRDTRPIVAQRGQVAADDLYGAYHAAGRTSGFSDVYERVRHRIVRDIMRDPALRTSGRMLDVGVGAGRYLPLWRELNPRATLVVTDVSATALARSSEHHPYAEHVLCDAEMLPFSDLSFDLLASIEVLEHVRRPIHMLLECHRVLKSGGRMLLSTPCGNAGSAAWWRAAVSGELGAGAGGGIRYGRFDDPTHLRAYTRRELATLCRAAGFEAQDTFLSGHFFTYVAERVELAVKRRIDIRRRSVRAARVLDSTLDAVALLDWRLLRRLPMAGTQVLVLRRI
jgi:SAM-dependent methyltransferase